jgi:hypothetical protein
MMNVASRTGFGVGVATAALSIAFLFIPYGYPLPSVAWAMLACATGVWLAKHSRPESPSVSDVIWGVEAESPVAAAVPVRTAGPTREVR